MTGSHLRKHRRSSVAGLLAGMLLAVLAAAVPASGTPMVTPDVIDPPFDGLDQSASGSAASDTILAAGASSVLQAVNRNLLLTTTLGDTIQAMPLEQFFGAAPPDGPVFDPKVYFDRNAVNQRFYAIALQTKDVNDDIPGNDIAWLHLAISRSINPADLNPGNWCRYKIDGLFTSPTTNQQKTHPDFPGLGVGADALVITTNQHTAAEFAVALVRAFDKLALSNNAASCPPANHWWLQPSGAFNDFSAYTLQPAQHYTSPTSFPGRNNPVYLVNSRHFTTSSTYRVWRLSNVSPFDPGVTPILENLSVQWATYSRPPLAPGGAAGAKTDTGDARIPQVAGVGDAITAVHTIACPNTPNTALESCFRTVRFVVGQANGAMAVTKSELQGLGGGDNAFYHHPGVAVNNNHQTVVVFLANLPANAHRTSSRVATKVLGGGFAQSTTLTAGTCARAPLLAGLPVRAGDYTGAQTAIDGNAFWVSAEHNDLINAVCGWMTRIAQVIP